VASTTVDTADRDAATLVGRAVFEHDRTCAACNINNALDEVQRRLTAETDRQNAEGQAQAMAKQRRERRN
jgi:hypothetical protein